jgi:8-oxo-dGTP diphosphatase
MDIDDLSLRYIMHRMRDDEIRTQYVYFGQSRTRDVHGNEEGKLHWVHLTDVLDLDVSATTRFIFQHYMEIGIHSKSTFIGALEGRSGAPTVNWIPISDWL